MEALKVPAPVHPMLHPTYFFVLVAPGLSGVLKCLNSWNMAHFQKVLRYHDSGCDEKC